MLFYASSLCYLATALLLATGLRLVYLAKSLIPADLFYCFHVATETLLLLGSRLPLLSTTWLRRCSNTPPISPTWLRHYFLLQGYASYSCMLLLYSSFRFLATELLLATRLRLFYLATALILATDLFYCFHLATNALLLLALAYTSSLYYLATALLSASCLRRFCHHRATAL